MESVPQRPEGDRPSAEDLQREHYDRISAEYEIHYGDRTSQEYRRRFMFDPLMDGIDLSGKRVMDAMCGSGESTPILVERGAHVVGLDISPVEVEKFRSNLPEAEAVCASILNTGLEAESFDVICVFGALHHLHPNLSDALVEIDRLLRPGGYFLFTEPHSGSLPDFFRDIWYRLDSFFAENEQGVDVASMKRSWQGRYDFEVESYAGGLAYLLVLNSLIFRIPVGWKKYYARVAMKIEEWMNPLLGPKLTCYVNCRWRKVRR